MSKSNENQEPYVLFENRFLELESEYNLSPEQLLVYGYFNTKQRFDNALTISCDIIMQQLDFLISKSKQNEMLNKLIHILNVLNDKNIVEISYKGKQITRYNVLEIKLPLIAEWTKEKANKGYVIIYYSLFDKLLDPHELYIYSLIKKFQGVGYLLASFGQWGKHLRLHRSTAQDKVNNFIKKNLIIKESGAWVKIDDLNKVFKQDVNKYYLPEFLTSNKEKIIKQDKIIATKEPNTKTETVESQQHNWYSKDKDVYPVVDDYYIYLTTSDQKLMKHADKRMVALSKTDFGKSRVDENMAEAKRLLNVDIQNKNKNIVEDLVKEQGHAVKLKNGYICLLNEIDDWSDVEAFCMIDNDKEEYYYNDDPKQVRIVEKVFQPHTDELKQFIIGEMTSKGELNAEIYDEIAANWRKINNIN